MFHDVWKQCGELFEENDVGWSALVAIANVFLRHQFCIPTLNVAYFPIQHQAEYAKRVRSLVWQPQKNLPTAVTFVDTLAQKAHTRWRRYFPYCLPYLARKRRTGPRNGADNYSGHTQGLFLEQFDKANGNPLY